MEKQSPQVSANIERFNGFATDYDMYRPKPPDAIIQMLKQIAEVQRPRLVVDLGSGTGLSTRVWAEHADLAIGIEPSDDMRREAEHRSPGLENIRYQPGLSTATGLPDGCADIVTCSQSLHWMEPTGTFQEVARLLRSGGVFAAYDCDWPPTIHWEVEQAYKLLMKQVARLEKEFDASPNVKSWDKSEHVSRMQESGHFRFVKEAVVHSIEAGNATRLIGLAISQGNVMALFKRGLTDAQIGIDLLREPAQRLLGDDLRQWYFSYRIRLAVK